MRLGCIQSENIELKAELQQVQSICDGKLDQVKLQAEQDVRKAESKIKELTKILQRANHEPAAREVYISSDTDFTRLDGSAQTTLQLCLECHNTLPVHISEEKYQSLEIPPPVYDTVSDDSLHAEVDQTCDISVSYVNQHPALLEDYIEQYRDIVGNYNNESQIGDNSL